MSTAYILLDKLVFKFEGKTAITSNPGNSLLSLLIGRVAWRAGTNMRLDLVM